MTWENLAEDLAEEFGGYSEPDRDGPCVTRNQLRHYRDRYLLNGWPIEYQRMKAKRARDRAERAAKRPPCPYCGSPVTRESKRGTAKLPKYCSEKCMRAARFARWWAAHKDERNARRRAS